jgi:methyl-accepting chemotaxis protein
MDDAVARVRMAADDTAQLSARVAQEAERGYRAVHKTLDEIERIRDLVEIARTTIEDLAARVGGIGQVVSVIEEIAQKTNLLALNASIIAAQAGQHGRGFAVVAGEIKALASRTAASTKEIAEQIAGIQDESVRARATMVTGVDAVNQGFHVAVGAGDALGEIRQSARAAQKKVVGIARAMEEQAGASRRVADATNALAAMARDFAEAARGHARAATASASRRRRWSRSSPAWPSACASRPSWPGSTRCPSCRASRSSSRARRRSRCAARSASRRRSSRSGRPTRSSRAGSTPSRRPRRPSATRRRASADASTS